jgi:hypothetical protein
LYSGGFIVPEKDEFVLRTTDSLQFWSITGQNLLRTLPFNGLLTNVRFLPGGDKITYSANTSDIYVINSNDGSQVFHLNVGNRRFDYFDFSANMKYLMFSDYYQFSAVYDTQNLQYIIDTSNHYYPRNIVYMTSDSSRAIAKQMITFYCNRNAEDPIGVYVYFDFDLTNDKRLNSIPEGFVAYPGKIVFNKDGSLISVWGQRYQTGNEPTLIALLNTADSSFIKYIDNAYPPIAFSPDSKYLLCIDSNKIQFHNIETNSVDRVLETDLNSITGLYYTPDGNTIVAMNNRYVNIYDNTTLNLFYKLDHSAADKNLKIMVQSQNGDIYFLEASNRLFTLLPLTGTEEETTTLSLPGNPSIADLTTDGRYLLCNESFDSLYVYDVINRSIKYSFKIPNRSYDDGLSDGFFGSEQDVWIDYIDNPVNNDDIFQGINLITGNMYYLMGEFRPFMSPDGAHYSSRLCPRTYYYSEIPDGLKTVVEDSPGRAVYSAPFPNPAVNTVRINCEYPVDNMTINLFDYNGRQVDPALYEAAMDQSGVSLNIGYLTHGLYFINLLSGNKIRYTGMVVKN